MRKVDDGHDLIIAIRHFLVLAEVAATAEEAIHALQDALRAIANLNRASPLSQTDDFDEASIYFCLAERHAELALGRAADDPRLQHDELATIEHYHYSLDVSERCGSAYFHHAASYRLAYFIERRRTGLRMSNLAVAIEQLGWPLRNLEHIWDREGRRQRRDLLVARAAWCAEQDRLAGNRNRDESAGCVFQ